MWLDLRGEATAHSPVLAVRHVSDLQEENNYAWYYRDASRQSTQTVGSASFVFCFTGSLFVLDAIGRVSGA
jgi:hypothetical protein